MSHKDSDIAYFVSFCIELYKKEQNITGEEAIKIFDDYRIVEYLTENFEILHTQNHHWLLEEISEQIRLRKETRS